MGSKENTISVLVTGFGPFEGHPVNASWEAVKELATRDLPRGVTLYIRDVPVEYKYVRNEIPKLERDFHADLILHVGVSGVTQCIQLENCAHSCGYFRSDVKGQTPNERGVIQECLQTSLNLNELRVYCEKMGCCCCIEQSDDAGRYLCEFIYYTSLKANVAPTLFIHVPCLDLPYSKEDLGDALRLIVFAALRQIAPELSHQ